MTDATDFDDDPPDAYCADCGDEMFAEDASVEAFELAGVLICDACFQERCEDESQ